MEKLYAVLKIRYETKIFEWDIDQEIKKNGKFLVKENNGKFEILKDNILILNKEDRYFNVFLTREEAVFFLKDFYEKRLEKLLFDIEKTKAFLKNLK